MSVCPAPALPHVSSTATHHDEEGDEDDEDGVAGPGDARHGEEGEGQVDEHDAAVERRPARQHLRLLAQRLGQGQGERE